MSSERPGSTILGGKDHDAASAPPALALLAIALLLQTGFAAPFALAAPGDLGPSFDCAKATSRVNRAICASPRLSALDRKLAQDFSAARLQAGIDGKALEDGESHWLKTVRNPCATEACLIEAYQSRDAAVLDLSLRAASPAAYDDTRPFTATPAAQAAALGLVGAPCAAWENGLAGAARIRSFAPVVANGLIIAPLAVQSSNFAFVLKSPDGNLKDCVVTHVVALPAAALGQRFMQCHLSQDSSGVAVRGPKGATLAYWSIDRIHGRLIREPIHVIGVQDLRCQDPETGE